MRSERVRLSSQLNSRSVASVTVIVDMLDIRSASVRTALLVVSVQSWLASDVTTARWATEDRGWSCCRAYPNRASVDRSHRSMLRRTVSQYCVSAPSTCSDGGN